MEHIDEFTIEGLSFVYIDVSHFKNNNEFIKIIDAVQQTIAKYPEQSVYTIINIDGIMFDSYTKEITAKCFERNKPYVKYGAVIGADGIKKIMVKAIFKISGRKNVHFCLSKEQAIEWLLQQSRNKEFCVWPRTAAGR
jgi:3-deoxy-D-arabino-heptulosonate 7-phosphate (DAHP) synthase